MQRSVKLPSQSSLPILPSSTLSMLPQNTSRAALGDLTNRAPRLALDSKAAANGLVVKPASAAATAANNTSAFQSSARASITLTEQVVPSSLQQPLSQHHVNSSSNMMGGVAPLDPMDTTLEDNIAVLTLAPAGSSVIPTPPVVYATAVDEHDAANAQYVSEYAQEILAYWRSAEMKRLPSPNYMSRQTDINAKMREILVDWMVEVQLKFKLKQETLFLSIHLLDRFLERRAVTRTKLQLVGCTALLLAAKYEEIYAPEIQDFVCISDKAYNREQILAMEGIMLNALGFNLTVPLSLNFLQRYARLAGVHHSDPTWYLSMYFMEMTLQSYVFLNFPPSQIAASALYLSMCTALNTSQPWSMQTQEEMGYTPAALATCINEMYKVVKINEEGTSKYKAVKKKYSSTRFMEVAKYICKPPQ